jgi:hypothetical protein
VRNCGLINRHTSVHHFNHDQRSVRKRSPPHPSFLRRRPARGLCPHASFAQLSNPRDCNFLSAVAILLSHIPGHLASRRVFAPAGRRSGLRSRVECARVFRRPTAAVGGPPGRGAAGFPSAEALPGVATERYRCAIGKFHADGTFRIRAGGCCSQSMFEETLKFGFRCGIAPSGIMGGVRCQ